jgi:hypothetical protein
MRIQIESTDQFVEIETGMGRVKGRVWDGATEGGVRVQCLIVRVAVHKDDDNSQFERELVENPPMKASGQRAFDPRMIL